MIKRLRNRFIRIAMLSVTAVMMLLTIILNVANYVSTDSDLKQTLTLIYENAGTIPHSRFQLPDSADAPTGEHDARRCGVSAPAGRHDVAGSRVAQRLRCGTLPWICQAGKRADLRQSAWRGADTVRKYIKCCTGLYTKSGCGRESRRPISEGRRGSFEFLEKERR